MPGNSPQDKAAQVSARNRGRRAQERKEREAMQAAAPICSYCSTAQSHVGVTVNEKPICRSCYLGYFPRGVW